MKNFFSKCDQIRSLLWIWSHLPKKILHGKLHFLCSDTKWSECGKISGVLWIYWFFSLGKSFLKLFVAKSKTIFRADHWSLWTILVRFYMFLFLFFLEWSWLCVLLELLLLKLILVSVFVVINILLGTE